MHIFETIHFTLAQAGKEGGSPFGTLLLIPVMLVVMYFLVIRPQRNEEKKRKEMIASLNKGDNVITTSGIHGKVTEVREADQTVVLAIAPNTSVTFSLNSVTSKKENT
ncbi:preprotein translocase subunit YajC [Leptospira sp. GIMC2001]|uniref:preprotein translocase subunit YajC n=1 Tax=Leptospira sp. GIMC2001 TaxID=1513297 RepID=UPI00234BD929|nr:preprotein translocase subunit YajC [Leptospira sp. GIMC2001]WCL48392.1 preprotein translocase subunit YajC [Leptospira sp. GIMC2001]